MKNASIIYLAGIIVLGVSQPAFAQEIRIGAVNAIRILEQSPQAEEMRAQIEKEFAPRDREMVTAQRKLKDMEDRLGKDAAIMSEAERRKLERDIITERRELKRSQDEFREDLTFRRNEEIANIQKEIIEAIQAVAKQHGYDVVLSEGVIFASTRVDMTQLVIDHLKKGTGAAAPAR